MGRGRCPRTGGAVAWPAGLLHGRGWWGCCGARLAAGTDRAITTVHCSPPTVPGQMGLLPYPRGHVLGSGCEPAATSALPSEDLCIPQRMQTPSFGICDSIFERARDISVIWIAARNVSSSPRARASTRALATDSGHRGGPRPSSQACCGRLSLALCTTLPCSKRMVSGAAPVRPSGRPGVFGCLERPASRNARVPGAPGDTHSRRPVRPGPMCTDAAALFAPSEALAYSAYLPSRASIGGHVRRCFVGAGLATHLDCGFACVARGGQALFRASSSLVLALYCLDLTGGYRFRVCRNPAASCGFIVLRSRRHVSGGVAGLPRVA